MEQEQEQVQQSQQKQTQAYKKLATENKRLKERIAKLENEVQSLRVFIGIGGKK